MCRAKSSSQADNATFLTCRKSVNKKLHWKTTNDVKIIGSANFVGPAEPPPTGGSAGRVRLFFPFYYLPWVLKFKQMMFSAFFKSGFSFLSLFDLFKLFLTEVKKSQFLAIFGIFLVF